MLLQTITSKNKKKASACSSDENMSELKEKAIGYVKSVLARAININESVLDAFTDLEKYGVNSLGILQINQEFENDRISIPLTQIFEANTAAKLADYIIDTYPEIVAEKTGFTGEIQQATSQTESEETSGGARFFSVGEETRGKIDSTYEIINVTPITDSIDKFIEDLKPASQTSILEEGEFNSYLPVLTGPHKKMYTLLVETEAHNKVEVMICGSGKPLVFICGVGMTAPMWFYQLRDFSDEYQVIIIHKPGHGRSDVIDDLRFTSIAVMFKEVLEKLSIQFPIILAGQSMGGIVAEAFAAQYPDLVSVLFLIGTSYRVEDKEYPVPEKILEMDLKVTLGDDASEEAVKTRQRFIQLLSKARGLSTPAFLKYIEKIAQNRSLQDILCKIEVPTLIIIGDNEFIFDPKDTDVLHKEIKNSEQWRLPKTAHFPHVTNYEEFNKRIARFIKKKQKKK